MRKFELYVSGLQWMQSKRMVNADAAVIELDELAARALHDRLTAFFVKPAQEEPQCFADLAKMLDERGGMGFALPPITTTWVLHRPTGPIKPELRNKKISEW